MTLAAFAAALERDLRYRGVAFAQRDMIDFTEANAVLIDELPEVDFWVRLFAEAQQERQVQEALAGAARLLPADLAVSDAGE